MEKLVQLVLPLNLPEQRIQLPDENEREVVAALAELLLQVLRANRAEEVEDESCS